MPLYWHAFTVAGLNVDSSPLIDREREQKALRALLLRPGPTMAVLYGRRRVGKTFLLRHVFPGDHVFHFTASDATPELNRRALLEAASRWARTEIRMQDFPTWRRVFEFIVQLGGGEPTVVVLDEYQFFHGGGDESVDSALAAVWEEHVNRRPKGRPLVLILCGSIVRVMERLDAANNPDRVKLRSHLSLLESGQRTQASGCKNLIFDLDGTLTDPVHPQFRPWFWFWITP